MRKHLFKFVGISLLEIMVTMSIIAILSSASFYYYQDYKTKTLYNNSINIMEQNKFIIYSYFSKYKECPSADIIEKNLDQSYHQGSKVINNQCDLILCQGSTEILAFNTTIIDNPLNQDVTDLNAGIQYKCVLPNPIPSDFTDITKYLPQCKMNENPTTSRC